MGFVANIKGRKSHEVIACGLEILVNLNHRGAVGADPLVGDGAGALIQIPDALYRDWADHGRASSCRRPATTASPCASCRRTARRASSPSASSSTSSAVEGQQLIGWRDVPIDPTGLGKAVLAEMPVIRQAFIARGAACKDQDAFERKLLVIRKQTQNPLEAAGGQVRPAEPDRPLHAVVLEPHGGLQGPAARPPGRHLLRRT